MEPSTDIYAPSPKEFFGAELFGARFPLGLAQLGGDSWTLGREAVPKDKNPKLAAYHLVDDVGATFKGTPLSGPQGDNKAQHFALIKRGSKTYAIPVEWFYVFKRFRKETKTVDEVAAEAKAKQLREQKVSRAFNKKFHIKDEDDEDQAGRKVKAVSQFDGLQRKIKKGLKGESSEPIANGAASFEPELEELFALDEDQAEGWDYDEDIANDDLEPEVNKEVVAERQEAEEAELEQEHLENEKELKKKGMVAQQEDGEDLQLDSDDDDAPAGGIPLVEVQRRQELEAEKQGQKHMHKLRKRVKHRQQNESILLNLDQSEDSDESDSDENSDDQGDAKAERDAAPSNSRKEGEAKRQRPEDMQGPFVAVKRATVSILNSNTERDVSQAASVDAAPAEADVSVGDLSVEMYASVAAAARECWPKDPLDQPLRQCRLKDVIEVIKLAYTRTVGRMNKAMIKEMFQVATKGTAGKPPFLEASGKIDGKTVFNIVM